LKTLVQKKKESTTTVCPGVKTSTTGWFYEIVCQLEGESDYSLMVNHHFVLGWKRVSWEGGSLPNLSVCL